MRQQFDSYMVVKLVSVMTLVIVALVAPSLRVGNILTQCARSSMDAIKKEKSWFLLVKGQECHSNRNQLNYHIAVKLLYHYTT